MSDVIACGPFIGDFETEVLSFRPYIVWLYKNLDFKDFYISSHHDRKFLYHWVGDNFIPVDDKFSDISKQDKYYNNDITHNQYFKLIRWLRNSVYNGSTKIKKAEIKIYTVPYTKLCDPVVYDKKVYTPIIMKAPKEDYILYDKKVYFGNYNYKILSDIESYADKVKAIISAKCVVCEAGLWTVIANMQRVPVFSWSEGAIGKYKSNGDLGFGNKNSIIYSDNENTLIKTMELFLRKIMEY